MMSLYILDTDHVSLFNGEHPLVTQRINMMDQNSLATTIITVQESVVGRLAQIKRAKSETALLWAYRDFLNTVMYFCTIKVLPFDQAAYQHYHTLRQQKIRIGTMDLRISAIALSQPGTVVTRNQRDFGRVPSLSLVDWSQE